MNEKFPGSPRASEAKYVEDLKARFPRLHVMRPSAYGLHLHTKIRDASTPRQDFVVYSNQLLRRLCETALDFVPTREKVVQTPTDAPFVGLEFAKQVCGVSILRSGSTMEQALRECQPDVCIGKILCQRDESKADKPAVLYYKKLPDDIADHHVILLDPMLATGGSAKAATQVLVEAGVEPKNITFVNLVSCPEGIEAYFEAYPEAFLVTAMVDERLNDDKYIMPGLGDFGDRYFL